MSGRRRPRVDLSFGPGHGPVSGVLNAAGAALGATMLLDLVAAFWLYGFVGGFLLAFTGTAVALWYDQPGRVVAYRAGCWLAAGFWSAWTLSEFAGIPLPFTDARLAGWFWSPGTPWAWRPIYGLAIGSAAAAAVGWHIERAERKAEQEAERLARQTEAQRLAAEEAALGARTAANAQEEIAFRVGPVIRRITKKNIQILNVELWDPDYGHTIDCELPDDGTTISDIKRYEEAIASALDLGEGCGVEIVRPDGLGRRAVHFKITTVSALGQDIPLPADYSPETIGNPPVIGVETDGKVAEVPLRFESAVLVGQTDSGKSNQLNVLVAGLARCTDVILCGIDLSGQGRFLRPWQRPYYEGRAAAPVFAYTAVTDVQAAALCQAIIQIIDGRTADYAALMHAEKEDKIVPRPTLPQLILVIDEFGKLPERVKELIITITDTGRGAAVRVVSCALEATTGYIPRKIITQSRVRIGMRVQDETQLQYLFDTTWRSGRFDPASMPWKGSGLYTQGTKFPDRFKGYRVNPAQVDQIAVAVAGLRPELDEASLRRGDTVDLTVRGDNRLLTEVTFRNVLTGNEADIFPLMFPDGAGPSAAAHDGEDTAMSQQQQPANTGPGADLGGAVRDLGAALERARSAADAAETGRDDGDQDDQQPGPADDPEVEKLNALLALPAFERARQDAPAPAPAARRQRPPRVRVQQLIAAAAADGIGPSEIHAALAREGYPTSLTTVNNWLREWSAKGIVVQPGGERTPWFPGPQMGEHGQAAA
jgi:hypothetical protein